MSYDTTSTAVAAAVAPSPVAGVVPATGVPPSAPGVAAGALAASRVAWAAASLVVGTRVTSSCASSAPPPPHAASTTSANEAIAIIAPVRRTLFRFNWTSASTTETPPHAGSRQRVASRNDHAGPFPARRHQPASLLRR